MLSRVNQVSAHERFITGWTFLITSTGRESSLVEAVSCVSIWSCIVVVTSDYVSIFHRSMFRGIAELVLGLLLHTVRIFFTLTFWFRCPMECTLSSDAQSWSCMLEIWKEYNTNGNHLSSIKCELFGNIIVNKSDVELWVRHAQAAVLNPQWPSSEFYNMSVDWHLRELIRKMRNYLSDCAFSWCSNNKFSKNVVQINVKDPEVTDLPFVDLPGSYPF